MFKKKDKKDKVNIFKYYLKKITNIKPIFYYISFVLFIALAYVIDGFLEIKFIIIFIFVITSICSYFYKKQGFIKDFVLIILFALIFRSFIFEPFHIPSGSMKPNLLIHDYIIVSKSTYGYSKYSLPFGLNLFSDRIFKDKVERGDVSVFKKPNETNINYIKRIIGLPGDKIQIINGHIFINNIKVKSKSGGYFKDKFKDSRVFTVKKNNETLPNNKIITVLDYGNFAADNTEEYLVPEDHYFVMGDNRDNSKDSRFSDVGFIPYENLVGEAKIIFFSAEHPFLQFWKWPFSIRFDRIFKLIK